MLLAKATIWQRRAYQRREALVAAAAAVNRRQIRTWTSLSTLALTVDNEQVYEQLAYTHRLLHERRRKPGTPSWSVSTTRPSTDFSEERDL